MKQTAYMSRFYSAVASIFIRRFFVNLLLIFDNTVDDFFGGFGNYIFFIIRQRYDAVRGFLNRFNMIVVKHKFSSIEPVQYYHGLLLFLLFRPSMVYIKSLNSTFATYFSEHPGSLQSYTGTRLSLKRSSSHNFAARNWLVV